MRSRLTLLIAALALLAAPGTASASIVTNGDFETGNLSGWQTANTPFSAWFVYTGTEVNAFGETFPMPAPPQGTHAAVTVQNEESRQILYQDITLPPGGSVNQLSLFAYYTANGPIVSPDTLDPSISGVNEQYRIDVMRPSSPIDSVASGDILLTVFRTLTGDPESIGPTQKTADLSAFAGQTVRLRFAVVVTNYELNAAADAVSVKSNGFTIGQALRNKKKGTAQLPVTVPDAGTLKISGKGVKGKAVATKAVAVQGGTVNLLIKAKGKAKTKLNDSGKAKVKPKITYTPTGVSSNTQQTKVKLKKKV
jgi:hypothetical protein